MTEAHATASGGRTRALHFAHAYLPGGFARDVAVAIEDGVIVAVEAGAPGGGARRVPGIALPGMPNLHCHAFQRGMAGLAERRGPGDDSFWTWREVMYRFLARLTPDDVEAIATFAYMEMLERGFTSVGEFHYLHHAPDGTPYADPAEMATRIAAAAAATGIGLTLLPSFYAHGGFGGAPPSDGQRRFINDLDTFVRVVERTRAIVAALPSTQVGIAPHSLRAVTPDELCRLIETFPDEPIHIHAAEQIKEVEDCVVWSQRRPVAWLLDHAPIDRRWCLVHATHMTEDETGRLARSGAVAGLCPLTEASLGDGTFGGMNYLSLGGTFGIGTDSNIDIDAAAELRQLEYSQRIAHRARNAMTTKAGESTGEHLFTAALAGGAQALARPIGAIAPGRRADFVVLDDDQPDLAAARRETWLDVFIFALGRSAIRSVFVGGDEIVTASRHRHRNAIVKRYEATLKKINA